MSTERFVPPIRLTMGTLAVLLLCGAVAAVADSPRMSRGAERAAEASGNTWVDVIVQFEAPPGQAEREDVSARGGQIKHQYRHFPMLALRVPQPALHGLARAGGVRFVSLDSAVASYSVAARQTAQLPAPGSAAFTAVSPNVGVAVLDSGVEGHADLNRQQQVEILPRHEVCGHQSVRAARGLQALYVFGQGTHSVVPDVSGVGNALDLTIEDPLNVVSDEAGLTVNSATRASNASDSNKIFAACTASDAITVETWITPGALEQGGPARIVTQSFNPSYRNFTLGQNRNRYQFRLRTTTNGGNGTYVTLSSAAHSVTTTRQHVVVTRDAQGHAAMYIDGVLVDSANISGSMSNWKSSFDFGLANEFSTSSTTTERDWVGTYELVAVYCEAHSAAEVQHNFQAGSPHQAACATPVVRDDPWGHGTHVAGIIGGDGGKSAGSFSGIAPGASVHSLRVLDDNGRGVVSDVIAGLDWVLANAAQHDIRVVNLSLGKAVEESAATDPLVQAVEAVWDAGIVVVASAGNHGRDGPFTITSPGNSPKIITVGSLTDAGTGQDTSDDYVSTYSSRGATLIDHFLKPDLVAPGNRVVAPIPGQAALKAQLADRVPSCGADCDGLYLELSGTSMAAAVVSGAAALMLSDDPSLTPATVKARLMKSARKIVGDATVTGAGVLDVKAALAATGIAHAAPSPKLVRSGKGAVILIEDTTLTWGSDWSAAYLWSDGYMWSDSYLTSDGYMWSDAYMWSDGYMWSDAYLWSDGYMWSDAYLWSDGYMWSDAVAEADPLWGQGVSGLSLHDD